MPAPQRPFGRCRIPSVHPLSSLSVELVETSLSHEVSVSILGLSTERTLSTEDHTLRHVESTAYTAFFGTRETTWTVEMGIQMLMLSYIGSYEVKPVD